MRREKRNQREEEDKIKWGKLISFIIAIILLGVAIAISMNQKNTVGELNYNNLKNNVSNTLLPTEEASSELSKNINEVITSNTVNSNVAGGDNKEEDDDEINEIRNSLQTSSNVVENNSQTTNEEKQNENANTKEQNTANTTEENKVEDVKFIYPVEGEVVKEFAKDSLIYSETLEEWITHTGIDIKADRSTVVKAVADGTVKSIKNDPRYGLTVTIEHSDGYVSSYSSLLTAEFVKEGEKVTQGQTIGTVGNSAVFEVAQDNHLHFELLKDGSNINPEMYLK